MNWYKIQPHHVELFIFAKPNAKRNAFIKITETELHCVLHAKPQHGKANQEFILFLAEQFDIPKTQIILKSGERSRHKKVQLPLTPLVRTFIENPLQWLEQP